MIHLNDKNCQLSTVINDHVFITDFQWNISVHKHLGGKVCLFGDIIGQLRNSTEMWTLRNTPLSLCLLSFFYSELIKANMVRCEMGSVCDSALDVDPSQTRSCEALL